jgi:PAS domain S-box-containing protein
MEQLAKDDLRFVRALVVVISIIVATVLPIGYYVTSFQHIQAVVKTEAHFKAETITQLIGKNPRFWMFEVDRLLELIERGTLSAKEEQIIIRDKNNEIILATGEKVQGPFISYAVPVFDAGIPVGSIEVSKSGRPLILNTIMIGGLSILVGILLYILLIRYLLQSLQMAYHTIYLEKEKTHITLRSIGDGVIATDNDGKVLLINKVAEQLTGWPEKEALGRDLSEIFRIINEQTGEPCRSPVEEVLDSMDVIELANHTILVTRSGREIVIADSAAPILGEYEEIVGVVLVFRDETEKRRAREEILKAHKLESLGTLAGGIAHDFNNLLTGIIGNISLAKLRIEEDHDAINYLINALNASDKAQGLTQQLLTFSRGGAPVTKPGSIGDLIQETSTFITSGTNVKFRFDLEDGLWPVEMDKGQMSQVLNNLIINAQQAMPTGGIIQVRAKNVTITGEERIPLPAGRYVRVKVKDSGVGIGQGELKSIFTPYYSTKEKGHGLGLAVSYSIIMKHQGYISAASKVGYGSTITFWLPASEKQQVFVSENVGKTADSGLAGKRILVMDDEDYIRNLCQQMLSRLRCEVQCVSNGQEAIAAYKRHKEEGQPFDLLLLDLTIPAGMGGKEAIQEISLIDPDVAAIVFSGYANDPIMAEYKEHGFTGVLPKPFDIEKLTEVLTEVLIRKSISTPPG